MLSAVARALFGLIQDETLLFLRAVLTFVRTEPFFLSTYDIVFFGGVGGLVIGLSGVATVPYLTASSINLQHTGNTPFAADISLSMNALSVNPVQKTITVDWYLPVFRPDCTVAIQDMAVLNVIMSQQLLDSTSPSWTPQPPALPLFALNTTEYCYSLRPFSFPPTFRTVTKLFDTNAPQYTFTKSRSSLQSYPFDVYIAPFDFLILNTLTGAITAPNLTRSFGVVNNYEITLQESFHFVSTTGNFNLNRLDLQFQVRRSLGTKVFVIAIGITNWLTTIVFLLIFRATFIYPDPVHFAEIFVVPTGAVFAFTSIRALFPGAPDGLGTVVDMYTILPCFVIMSICSSLLLLRVLRQRFHPPEVRVKVIQTASTPTTPTTLNGSGFVSP